MATTANALIHTVKLVLMSTGILFIAILLTPQILNLMPAIWTSFRSWLRPPYLYVIINGIIITIAASSRLHHHYKHPHAAAGEEFRHVQHNDVQFRSSGNDSGETYTYADPKAPIVSVPVPEVSTIPVHEAPLSLAGFSFNLSYGAVLDNQNAPTPEAVSYDEPTVFGVRESGIVPITPSPEPEVVEKQRNYDLVSVDGGSAEVEVVARRSVSKMPSSSPQPSPPLARQETFEVVSSFFHSQLEKSSPPARLGQNQKPSRVTLTSLDETATSGGRQERDFVIPSPTPLARQETAEIVSSFFQSQMEKSSPSTRGTLTSLHETTTFGGLNEVREEKVRTPAISPPPATLARQETSEIVSSFFQSQMGKSSPPARNRIDKTVTFARVDEVNKMKDRNYNIALGMPLPPPPVPLARQETSEIVSSFFQTQIEKPPPSTRFGHHRRPSKATPEGGKALRVTKPKKSETLESAWKTITEGRHMPLTRHLKKSDTWENHNRQPDSSDPSTPSVVKKSETFTDRTNFSTEVRSAVTAKLKKDPSLSQDELNRRVEAFITKVNEEMRLQRQKSMQQYMEMINR